MPPYDPGSLADDSEELMLAWQNGPESVDGAEWIIPPARGQPARVVNADYPYQAWFNRANSLKGNEQSDAASARLEALSSQLKALVDVGKLTEQQAKELFEAASGKR